MKIYILYIPKYIIYSSKYIYGIPDGKMYIHPPGKLFIVKNGFQIYNGNPYNYLKVKDFKDLL